MKNKIINTCLCIFSFNFFTYTTQPNPEEIAGIRYSFELSKRKDTDPKLWNEIILMLNKINCKNRSNNKPAYTHFIEDIDMLYELANESDSIDGIISLGLIDQEDALLINMPSTKNCEPTLDTNKNISIIEVIFEIYPFNNSLQTSKIWKEATQKVFECSQALSHEDEIDTISVIYNNIKEIVSLAERKNIFNTAVQINLFDENRNLSATQWQLMTNESYQSKDLKHIYRCELCDTSQDEFEESIPCDSCNRFVMPQEDIHYFESDDFKENNIKDDETEFNQKL